MDYKQRNEKFRLNFSKLFNRARSCGSCCARQPLKLLSESRSVACILTAVTEKKANRSSELRNDSNYILEGVVEFKIYLNYR